MCKKSINDGKKLNSYYENAHKYKFVMFFPHLICNNCFFYNFFDKAWNYL